MRGGVFKLVMNSRSSPTYRAAKVGMCQRQKDTIQADGDCQSQPSIIGERPITIEH